MEPTSPEVEDTRFIDEDRTNFVGAKSSIGESRICGPWAALLRVSFAAASSDISGSRVSRPNDELNI